MNLEQKQKGGAKERRTKERGIRERGDNERRAKTQADFCKTIILKN